MYLYIVLLLEPTGSILNFQNLHSLDRYQEKENTSSGHVLLSFKNIYFGLQKDKLTNMTVQLYWSSSYI